MYSKGTLDQQEACKHWFLAYMGPVYLAGSCVCVCHWEAQSWRLWFFPAPLKRLTSLPEFGAGYMRPPFNHQLDDSVWRAGFV